MRVAPAQGVLAADDVNFRRLVVALEVVVAGFEHAPEVIPAVLAVGGEVGVCHAEGEGVHAHVGLAALERRADEGVDFFDLPVAHGIAADGDAFAVYHQHAAAVAVRAIVGVGVAEVEGEVVLAVGVHRFAADSVEAFGRLFVAFAGFRAEFAGVDADGVVKEKGVFAAVFLQPDFEHFFFFEDADEGGCTEAETARFEAVLQGGVRRTADEAAVALGFGGTAATCGEDEGEGGEEEGLFFHGVSGWLVYITAERSGCM